MKIHRPGRNSFPAIIFWTGLVSAVSAGDNSPLSADWAKAPLWRDGMAEVSRYDSTQNVYNKARKFETVAIVVREELDAAQMVKADPPLGGRQLLPVLKLNLVQEIPTENYDYRYLASAFVEVDAPWRLVKESVSSQEWCGATFKALYPTREGSPFFYYSYWDGRAVGADALEWRTGDMSEEQLIVSLRGLAASARSSEMPARILSNQIQVKAPAPVWREGVIKSSPAGAVEVPAGRFEGTKVEITFKDGASQATFVFDRSAPHVLLKADFGDGRTLSLRETKRNKYWERSPDW